MRKLIVLATLLYSFSFATSFAQDTTQGVLDTSSRVALIAYWDKGDVFNYKVTKTDIDSLNHLQKNNKIYSYLAQFTVLDSLEEGYRIEWKTIKRLDTIQDLIPEELMTQALELNNDQLVFKTSPKGEFMGIENHEKLGKFVADYLNMMMVKDSAALPEESKAIMKVFINYFQSKEGVESMILPEIKSICTLLGNEYSIKDTISYQTEFPIPIASKPLPAQAIFYCDYYDDTFVSFYNNYFVERDDYISFVKDLFKDAVPDLEVFDKIDCSIAINNYYAYHLSYGVPAEAYTEQLIKVTDENGQHIVKQKIVAVEMVYEDDN